MAYIGPQPNVTDIVGWQPNPLVRGTADILTTCVITLSLCIWSALHLNVSGTEGWYRRLWAKIFWAILCLIAPEIVAFNAWDQRRHARKLAAQMNEALGLTRPPSFLTRLLGQLRSFRASFLSKPIDQDVNSRTDEEMANGIARIPANQKHYWTLKHGFFARMGGFGLRLPPGLVQEEEEHYIITQSGIELLAKFPEAHKDIPDLSKEYINSLSRASSFAKLIVSGQAIWFCVQCIVRLSSGLPVSLLEVNTFAHAICILLTIIFWWEKPYDIERPYYFETMFLYPAAAHHRITTETSSVAEVWTEQAQLFLSDQEAHYEILSHWGFSETRYSRPCKDLALYLVKPSYDLQVLPFDAPEHPDESAFVRFCSQSFEPKSPLSSSKVSISWADPMPHTGFSMLPTVPGECFKTVSPLTYPGYTPTPARKWLIHFVHFIWLLSDPDKAERSPLFSSWPATLLFPIYLLMGACLASGFLVLAPFGALIAIIIPQARGSQIPGRSFATGDILSSGRVARKPRCDSTGIQPCNITHFIENGGSVPQIREFDAVLLEAAWQHIQSGLPEPITKTRISEWSDSSRILKVEMDKTLFISLPVYTGIYGGLHLAVRGATFQHDILRLFWEIASIIVIVGVIPIALAWKLADWLARKSSAFTQPFSVFQYLNFLGQGLVHFSLYNMILGYGAARLYLIAESSMALSYQPSDVYIIQQWSAYWPHIS